MKKILKISFLIVIFLTIGSCNGIKVNKNSSTEMREIVYENNKIIKIDSIQTVYLIYLKKNDSIFKIVSAKENGNGCNKIKEGDILTLEIESVFNKNFHEKRDIAGVKYNDVLIKLEKNIVWDLFTTKNLSGLCYKNGE